MRVRLFALGFGASLIALHGSSAQEDVRPRDRAALQQRFQERFAAAVRERVGLSDDQMPKLMEVNRRFEDRRRELLLRERDIRNGMREELAPGMAPNEDHVRQLLDDQFRVQRERLQLIEDEQVELAKFMTPSQRARYFGMQEQMRRKVEQLRGGPPGGPDGPPDMRDRPRMRRLPPDTALR